MTIEIDKDARKEAIASIERYFKANMEAPVPSGQLYMA
jgi:hypothetical protein